MSTHQQEIEQELLRQIAESSKSDPLIGARIGAKLLNERLLEMMKSERGVHIESVLCALGALAGYACQAAVRAQSTAQGLAENALLIKVATKTGKSYFFGEELNKPLSAAQHSIWSLAAQGARLAGCTAFPDLKEIYEHTAAIVGTETFGLPRLPQQHAPNDFAENYLRVLWPVFQPSLGKVCIDPAHWPVLFGIAIQEVILAGRSAIDPGLALRLVMECAVAMSKVDLAL